MNTEILQLRKDGGPESHVWGYFIVAIKALFSIVVLRFENGSREAYHSHAFNCFSWVLKGELLEQQLSGPRDWKRHLPSWKPFITRRSTFHMVVSVGRTWVLSIRGPWSKYWHECIPKEGRVVTLTWGRKVTNEYEIKADGTDTRESKDMG